LIVDAICKKKAGKSQMNTMMWKETTTARTVGKEVAGFDVQILVMMFN